MYRILTENKNRAQIKSLIIEFEGDIKEKVLMAAELIRKFNTQQEVLVQEIPSTVTVVK